MSIESDHDLENLKQVGEIVSNTIQLMCKNTKAGVSTGELDRIARKYFESKGARSAPELDYSFPGATCISVNHEVAHGIPCDRILSSGDMVNLDVSLEFNGYYADAGYTVVIDDEDQNSTKNRLAHASIAILESTIKLLSAGDYLNKIGFNIEKMARKSGYNVIKNLAGHGIGHRLHEYPDSILNYGDPSDRRKLKKGIVLAVETFISTESQYVMQKADGWTLSCPDRSLVAQYEHTIVITDQKPIVLTAMDPGK